MNRAKSSSRTGHLIALFGLVGVLIAGSAVISLVLLSITEPEATAAAGYLPLAWAAAAVLITIAIVSFVVRRIDVAVIPAFPGLIGLVAFIASFVPWLGIKGLNPDLGILMYRGLKVPQGIMQFWDLTLVMLSIDCARWGFDIYVDNNGCMQDASIYAPGMAWLQYVPFKLFSQAHVPVLGVLLILISSIALAWLARQSAGVGQLALLIAAVGGPWLLLLERANIDAVVLWAAIVAVVITRRWGATNHASRLWPWIVAATILWLMGTWKYYPFVMGAMLLPVFRVRYGWAVVLGYGVAAAGFVILTWRNFLFSLSSNDAMIDFGDFVVLGRVPLVARMLGNKGGAEQFQFGDFLVVALVLAAFAWGVGAAITLRRLPPWTAMLAVSGSTLYLASVLVAGFGWGYKAVFLLLAIPLVSRLVGKRRRLLAGSGLAALLLIGVQSVVVWNVVMVTTAGVIAAGFALGLGLTVILRPLVTGKRELARP